jgi:hypothetical protein
MVTGVDLWLTEQQHADLSTIAQSRSLPAGYVFRAKLILLLAEGVSFSAIKQRLQTTAPTISRWKSASKSMGWMDWTVPNENSVWSQGGCHPPIEAQSPGNFSDLIGDPKSAE